MRRHISAAGTGNGNNCDGGMNDEVMSKLDPPHLSVSGFTLITTIITLSVVLFPLCFILFYTLNMDGIVYVRGVPQLPTLSLTGGYWPELGVFTFLLHSFAILSFFIFSMVSEVLREKLRSDCLLSRFKKRRRTFRVINVVLYWIGVLFAITICVTGSIPVTIQPTIHAIFAIIMFILGCAHILIFKFSFGLEGVFSGVNQNYWHLTAVILVAPVNAAALITAAVVASTCVDIECNEFSIQMVVIVEYITAVALLLYVAGFFEMRELKETYLTIQLPTISVSDDNNGGDRDMQELEMT